MRKKHFRKVVTELQFLTQLNGKISQQMNQISENVIGFYLSKTAHRELALRAIPPKNHANLAS